MRKLLVCFIAAVSLFVLAITLAGASENANVQFASVGSSSASGEVNIEESNSRFGPHRVKLMIEVENVDLPAGRILEGWLVDSDSGYNLSLGAFPVNSNGYSDLLFEQSMVHFYLYDKIVVTSEKIDDTNPVPDKIILEARIPKASSAKDVEAVSMKSTLNGSQEVPPTSSKASGKGEFEINTKANTLKFNVEYSNLSANETSAHIHGFALPGNNTGVLFPLPLGAKKEGVWVYNESMESSILSGLTYVNVHSLNFPNGEIRGQIVPNKK